MKHALAYLNLDSPVGRIFLVAQDDILIRLEFADQPHALGGPSGPTAGSQFLADTRRQLEAYFEDRQHVFDISLKLQGSSFQEKVWNALLDLSVGETLSYSQFANRIGHPDAIRAVGAANGRNPISIIIPCHRLIGTDGHLTGYAGGLEAKRWLLRHEGHKVEENRVTGW
mgnify:CR=1 FL=1